MRISLAIGLIGLAAAVAACSPAAPASGSGAAASLPTSPGATGTVGGSSTAAPSSVAGTPASRATPAPSATAAAASNPARFALTSSAFKDGAAIPSRATCDGVDASPELDWTGAPAGTRALALIVTDPDAGDFVHWLAFDMTGAPDGRLGGGIEPSADPPGQGRNDFGKRGYGGPCPPSGEHHYRFDLFALDRPLGLSGTPRITEIRAAMQGHVLGQTRLTGTYRRN